jgi:hypothetical protein
MSYSDRRLRQAAEEADRQQSNSTTKPRSTVGFVRPRSDSPSRETCAPAVGPKSGLLSVSHAIVTATSPRSMRAFDRPRSDKPRIETVTAVPIVASRPIGMHRTPSTAPSRRRVTWPIVPPRPSSRHPADSPRRSRSSRSGLFRQNVREAIGTGAEIETRVRTEREQALVRGTGEIFNVPPRRWPSVVRLGSLVPVRVRWQLVGRVRPPKPSESHHLHNSARRPSSSPVSAPERSDAARPRPRSKRRVRW